jgi:hypothetical protein
MKIFAFILISAISTLSLLHINLTNSIFSDTEAVTNNTFTTTIILPSPGTSPQPSSSPTSKYLVINEVFYYVDSAHGFDSVKDRGTDDAFKNSPGCNVNQNNQTIVDVNVESEGNTGGVVIDGNTGDADIETGDINNDTQIDISGGDNIASCDCNCKLKQNDEWIELYNPTDTEINLKNWKLVDNSGQETIIHANKKIPIHGFALISKSASTWQHWQVPSPTLLIELGRPIGDGLDNGGDHIYLKNSQGDLVDAVAWGDDKTVWDPAINKVAEGSSDERKFLGVDTNVTTDWQEKTQPTPGL